MDAEAYVLCLPWTTDKGAALRTQPVTRQGTGAPAHPFIAFLISFLPCTLSTVQALAETEDATPMGSEYPVPCTQEWVKATQVYCPHAVLPGNCLLVQDDTEEIKISFMSLVLCNLKCILQFSDYI